MQITTPPPRRKNEQEFRVGESSPGGCPSKPKDTGVKEFREEGFLFVHPAEKPLVKDPAFRTKQYD